MIFALQQIVEFVRDRESFELEGADGTTACARFLYSCAAWQLRARWGPRLPWSRPERLTVILLSFRRVRNIEPIVRSLLPLDCVGRILVSNNNPRDRIADWVKVRDPRLEILDQPAETFCGVRFELARRGPGEYFLAVDDDVFLAPEQVQQIFDALLDDPERVHGIRGEVFPEGPFRGSGTAVEQEDAEVDNLNQVYAFTRDHVEELFRVAARVGENAVNCIADDMLLSFSGAEKPRCHDVGPILHCLSADRAGLATYRTLDDFFGRRARLFQELRAQKDGAVLGI